MWKLLVAVAAGVPTPACRTSSGFDPQAFTLQKRPVNDSAAVCNDGSQAQLYFRPCCNGETAGDFCNESAPVWLVVFGDGNADGWCWDAESCDRRFREYPALSSSSALSQTFNRSGFTWQSEVGAFSKGGEVNQNFYKSYAAYIPSCSSDLFLGKCEGSEADESGPKFCGKTIAKAAIRNLLPEINHYGAAQIILVGGAGIMTYISELAAMLPTTAVVSAVCDGCAIQGLGKSEAADSDCSDSDSCAPDTTLSLGVPLWRSDLPASCGGWECLLSKPSDGLIQRAAGQVPLLVQQPLYDAKVFTRAKISLTNATFAAGLRNRTLEAVAGAKVVLGSACSGPESSFTHGEFFNVTFGGGIPPLSFASALYKLLHDQQDSAIVDSCQGVDCNPTCLGSQLTLI
mmetsp:Transcript_18570/g.41169  ORF Transcript_18570/g.41169 Transcript_18570/m.41169 type:complete len:401 (+) Transcript_18570:142-1344(+)